MDEKSKQQRRKSIGGSDVAAILGLSPWRSAMDVWLDKMGLVDSAPDPERQFLLDLGTELEPVIANLYTKRTGRSLQLGYPIAHKEHAFLVGNPDRLVDGEKRGVELKTENHWVDNFGEPGTDEIPPYYLLQCAHYMAVTEYPEWDVALLRGGAAFSIYTIKRDMELERDMIGQLHDWWEKHVLGQRAPDVDGSGAWTAYLKRKFPADILPVRAADEETLKLISNFQVIDQIIEQYTELHAEMQHRLKLVIGEHEGLTGDFGRITWKKTKERQHIDWQQAFWDLTLAKAGTDPQEIVKAHTEVRPGVRRFLFQPRKDWTYGLPQLESDLGALPGGTDAGNGVDGTRGTGQGADRSALRDGGTAPERP